MPSRRLAALLGCALALGCESLLLDDDPLDSPESNFELLWDQFDRWYSGFLVRGVDWDALYAEFRPRVTPATSREELWDVVTGMLVHLDDPHVLLQDPRRRRLFNASNPRGLQDPMDLDLVIASYLRGQFTVSGRGRFISGEPEDGIGYLYITDFAHDDEGPLVQLAAWTRDIDGIVSGSQGLDAMIVDVRSNHGGDGENHARIAGAFADGRRLAYTVETRNGPGHNDFDDPFPRYVEPMGRAQFTKPVVVMTDHSSTSAAETFSLYMAPLPHVTLIGDSTAGGFSTVTLERYLPNAWVYHFSHQLYRLPDGTSPEGIGVVPDIIVTNTPEELEAGRDRMLECAIAFVRSGASQDGFDCP